MLYDNEKIPYRTFEELGKLESCPNQLWALMHLFDVLIASEPEDEFWFREDFDLNSQYLSNKNFRDAFEIYFHKGNYIAVNEFYKGYRIEITPVLRETASKYYLRATHERNPEEWRKEGWEVFEDDGGYYVRSLANAKKRWCYEVAVFDDREPYSIKHTLLKRKKIMDHLYEIRDLIKEREAKTYDRPREDYVEGFENQF